MSEGRECALVNARQSDQEHVHRAASVVCLFWCRVGGYSGGRGEWRSDGVVRVPLVEFTDDGVARRGHPST